MFKVPFKPFKFPKIPFKLPFKPFKFPEVPNKLPFKPVKILYLKKPILSY